MVSYCLKYTFTFFKSFHDYKFCIFYPKTKSDFKFEYLNLNIIITDKI